jgi:8-oxo-dGTP pyrophosphatase MutT (NUDIX family)
MKGKWGFPKGMIDPGETSAETARKEALEEAGIEGAIEGPPLGSYDYAKWGLALRATFYLMEVERCREDWPESEMRERRWCAYDEAYDLLGRDELRTMLARARDRLETGRA